MLCPPVAVDAGVVAGWPVYPGELLEGLVALVGTVVVEVEVPGWLDVLGAVVAAPPGTVVLGFPPGTDVLGTLDELVLGQGTPVVVGAVVVGAVVVVPPWREEVVVVDGLLVVGPAPPAEVDVVVDDSVVDATVGDVTVLEPQGDVVVGADPGAVVLVGRLGAAVVDVVDDVEAAADEPVAARDSAM